MAEHIAYGATVEQAAEAVYVDPGDVRALIASFPADVVDLWEEQGVLSKAGVQQVHDVINPWGMRTHPEL